MDWVDEADVEAAGVEMPGAADGEASPGVRQ
jgi:hypothetical protein